MFNVENNCKDFWNKVLVLLQDFAYCKLPYLESRYTVIRLKLISFPKIPVSISGYERWNLKCDECWSSPWMLGFIVAISFPPFIQSGRLADILTMNTTFSIIINNTDISNWLKLKERERRVFIRLSEAQDEFGNNQYNTNQPWAAWFLVSQSHLSQRLKTVRRVLAVLNE